MSGTSYSGVCPRCNSKNLMCSSNYKPFDCVGGECLDCGFIYYTEVGQLNLKEVNQIRQEYEKKKMKKLKKQVREI